MPKIEYGDAAITAPSIDFIGDLLKPFFGISSFTIQSQTTATATFTDPDGVKHDIILTGSDFGANSGTVTGLELKQDDTIFLSTSGLDMDFSSLSAAVGMADPAKRAEIIDAFAGYDWTLESVNAPALPGYANTVCGSGGDDWADMTIYRDVYFADGGNDVIQLGLGRDDIYLGNAYGYAGPGTANVDGGISNKDRLHLGDGPGFTTFDHGQTVDMANLRFSLHGYTVVITGVEIVLGTRYADLFKGAGHADTLYGKGGNDHIGGGLRGDSLYGGQGDDVFIYSDVKDSTTKRPDLIEDFKPESDRINLSALAPHDDTGRFHFVEHASHTAGDLWVSHLSNGGQPTTVIEANINGDDKPDIEIDLAGSVTLHSQDFML